MREALYYGSQVGTPGSGSEAQENGQGGSTAVTEELPEKSWGEETCRLPSLKPCEAQATWGCPSCIYPHGASSAAGDAGPIKTSKTRLILGNDLQDGAVGEVVELSAGPQEYPALMVGLRMGWPRVSVSEGGAGGCGPVAGPHGEQGQEGRWEAVVNSSLEIPAEVRKAPSLPAPCPGQWVPGTVGDSWLTLCLQEWTAGERLLSGHLLPLPGRASVNSVVSV